VAIWAAPRGLPLLVQAAADAGAGHALRPLIYRLAYESLADASVLVLLIVSVGVHFALVGLGLSSSVPRASATRASGTSASASGR
jgi:branched-chain amino acid transport system permease protein